MDYNLLYIIIILALVFYVVNKNDTLETLRNIKGVRKGGVKSFKRLDLNLTTPILTNVLPTSLPITRPPTLVPALTPTPTLPQINIPTIVPPTTPGISKSTPRVAAIRIGNNLYHIKDNKTGQFLFATTNNKLAYGDKPSVFSFKNGNLVLTYRNDNCITPSGLVIGDTFNVVYNDPTKCNMDTSKFILDNKNRVVSFSKRNLALSRHGDGRMAKLIKRN